MTFTDLFLDRHLDLILRASGSALKHYSMQKTKDDMRVALRSAVEAANAELRKEHDDLLQKLEYKKYVIAEADDHCRELEQRLAGQVPSPAAVEPLYSEPKIYGSDEATYCVAQTATIERMEEIILTYCAENPGCGLGEIVADLRLMLITEHSKPAAVGAMRKLNYETVFTLCEEYRADYNRTSSVLRDYLEKHSPTSAGVPDEIKRAIRSAKTAMNMWENGYAFDTHGKSRDIQREIEIADALLAARPTSETTTQPAADGGGE